MGILDEDIGRVRESPDIVAVISQTGSNQLGAAFLVNHAPLIVELRTLIVELCTTRL